MLYREKKELERGMGGSVTVSADVGRGWQGLDPNATKKKSGHLQLMYSSYILTRKL